jgi:hypothetical protein
MPRLATPILESLIARLELAADVDLADKLSVKRLGKRLSMLWPHLEKILATGKQEKDRNHYTIYTLKARDAECAECQSAFSTKPPRAHTQ